jgi:hypothetical protein
MTSYSLPKLKRGSVGLTYLLLLAELVLSRNLKLIRHML